LRSAEIAPGSGLQVADHIALSALRPVGRARPAVTLAAVTDPPQLSLAEWIVLALIAEQPRHGFAVASLTAADGDVGRAWQVPRPIVYRAMAALTRQQLIEISSTGPGGRGPQRSVYAVSAAGADAVRRWLRSPVQHVRDTRSELLVKIALLGRRGWSLRPLITAQRRVFTRREAGLLAQLQDETGFGRVLVTWRLESARAALRLLADIETSP
jgi:PadR family transcriptional regulator AphA